MKPKDIIESSVSGYITDSFEGISGNFTDIEIISVSATNIVAKAKRYGRWWLLKGIPKDKAEDEGLLLRLRKEFEMMISLQHPNVVAASSIENVEKLGQCIVMEYVEGITLKEWLKNKSALRERRRLAWEITQAVAYMHSVGIIHRDLKPANIIVTSNGENIKIIDFGLSDTDSHSVLKQPAGSVSYMSPEQRAVFLPDVKNDIYSLGVIFSEMDLGYGKIVKKCTCDITNRYPNVAALQDDIRKRNNLLFGTIMAVAVVAIIVSAALGAISYFNMKKVDDAQSQNQNLRETVAALNDSISSISSTYDRMSDSIRVLSANNSELKQYKDSTESRNAKVLKYVNDFNAKLNALVKKYATPEKELTWDKYSDMVWEGSQYFKSYRAVLPTLTPKEASELWQTLYFQGSQFERKYYFVVKKYNLETIPVYERNHYSD